MKNYTKNIINSIFVVIFSAICFWLFFYFSEQPISEIASNTNTKTSFAELKVTPLNAKPFLFNDLEGKVILINIWATWCGPCRIEIPDLISLKNEFGSQIEIVGLSVDSSSKPVTKFLSNLEFNYPVSMMSSQLDSFFSNVAVIPTTFIFDSNLNFKYQLKGYHNKQMLRELIVPLINESK